MFGTGFSRKYAFALALALRSSVWIEFPSYCSINFHFSLTNINMKLVCVISLFLFCFCLVFFHGIVVIVYISFSLGHIKYIRLLALLRQFIDLFCSSNLTFVHFSVSFSYLSISTAINFSFVLLFEQLSYLLFLVEILTVFLVSFLLFYFAMIASWWAWVCVYCNCWILQFLLEIELMNSTFQKNECFERTP